MALSRRVPTPFLFVLLPYSALVARFSFVTDDAYISFRYARNLADGLGLRYNVGVEPPVEGFSNFLWIIWLAPFEALGWDVTLWSRLTSVACGVVLLWRVARLLERRVTQDTPTLCCGLLLLATLPPLAVWSTGGLATMPFTLLIFLAFESLLGDPDAPRGVRTGLLFVLVALIRADGPLFVGLVLAAAGSRWLLAGRSRKLLRACAVALGIFLAGLLVLLAFRYSYFGELVPNTAKVKMGFSTEVLERGANYVAIFLLTFLSVPLLLAVSMRGLSAPKGGLRTQALLVAGGTVAYAVLVGGDFMCMQRFLIPALPFLAILFTAALASVAERNRGLLFGLTAVCLALSLLPAWNTHLVPQGVRQRFHYRWRVDKHASEYDRWHQQRDNTRRWSQIGRALAAHAQPGDSLVIPQIGAIGYYSRLLILDRRGLVSRDVASRVVSPGRHSPGHGIRAPLSFFADRKPTYVSAGLMLTSHAQSVAKKRFDALFDQFPEDEGLRSQYESVLVPLDPAEGFDAGTSLWAVRRIE